MVTDRRCSSLTLGSYIMNRFSLYYDISGRVTKETKYDNFFTVGGALFPSSQEDKLRSTLPADSPKWKQSTPESLNLISECLRQFDILCTAVKFEKTQPAWDKFWQDGENQHQYFASKLKGKVGFAKPGYVMKAYAINKCSAIGLGSYLRLYANPTVLDQDGYAILSLKVVCDTEIQGDENQETFIDHWRVWAKTTRLIDELGIKPYIEQIEFSTEQQDSLLTIPDIIAGCVQYISDPDNSELPDSIKNSEAEDFYNNVISLNRLNIVSYPFDELFPNLTKA